MSPADFCYFGVVVVAFISSAQAIKCYQCSSHENPACAEIDPNDTSSPFLHKCEPRDEHQIFCRKTIQTILDPPKVTRITRSCGWIVHKSNTSNCLKTDTDFKLETTCQCFTEGCNAGTVLTVTPILGIVFLAVLSWL